MNVSVFSDIASPWSYIGVTRFERAAAAVTLSTGARLDVTLRAYQVDPDAAPEGRPLLETEAERLGGSDEVDAMVKRVRAAATVEGLDIDLEAAVGANTFDAHRLLTWANEHAGVATQRDLARELWRAQFAEGADVSDHDTLAARAGLVGLDLDLVDDVLSTDVAADEVRMQLDAARDLGIDTAPTFVLDGTWMIAGIQPRDAIERALTELVSSVDTD